MDIGKQTVKVDCPACKRSITVTLLQVAGETLVKCSCGQKIQLKDSKGTNQKAINDINKSLKDFENTLKKFSR